MKKLLIAAFALTTAASVFAQGSVQFQNRISAGIVQTTHIWGPSTTNPGLSLIGLGSNDTPTPGATAFGTASGMSLIGASGSGGKYGYTTTFAQLIGAEGSGIAEASLKPLGQTTTFKTGTSLGGVALITDTLSGASPVSSGAAYATFEIVAWDNSTSQYSTWTQASAAWLLGTIAAGHSAKFNVSAIGGGLNSPPNLNNMESITSFNLYFIPEPSTFALAGLGMATLLVFRRRK